LGNYPLPCVFSEVPPTTVGHRLLAFFFFTLLFQTVAPFFDSFRTFRRPVQSRSPLTLSTNNETLRDTPLFPFEGSDRLAPRRRCHNSTRNVPRFGRFPLFPRQSVLCALNFARSFCTWPPVPCFLANFFFFPPHVVGSVLSPLWRNFLRSRPLSPRCFWSSPSPPPPTIAGMPLSPRELVLCFPFYTSTCSFTRDPRCVCLF